MHRAKRADTHTTGWRMARPIILTVDDDVTVSQAITRDLRSRYADRYRIVRATSGAEALATLDELAQRDLQVALIVSDHRMPEMTGIELLERSRPITPGTKRVLLTAYADTDVAIKAINDIGLDHYLMKPWAPPEERLYPVLDDLLDEWDRANSRFEGVRVVGNKWSERSYDTRMFLARNHVAYQWLELERDAEAQRLHELFAGADSRAPVGPDDRRQRAARGGPAGTRRCTRAQHQGRVGALRRRGRRRRPGRTWRRRCTRRRRGCAWRSSSATPPAGRPARVPASRTTSGFPTGSAVPTCRTGPPPRPDASAPRWCSPVSVEALGTQRLHPRRSASTTAPRSRPAR